MFTSKKPANKKLIRIKIIALILYGCFLIALSFLKTAEVMLPTIYQLESMLGGDKLMHLTLSSLLSFIALWALVPNLLEGLKFNIARWLLWCLVICALLITGLLIDELHQAFVKSRRFEWLDLAYGVGGIGVGCIIFIVINLPKLTHKYE
jgi:hypothetical protein